MTTEINFIDTIFIYVPLIRIPFGLIGHSSNVYYFVQVFRFIGVAMTGRMVSDILSRLVETVAEQGEDMQGYVTELLLTLEAAVDSLESNFRPLDYMRDIFKSTPNLNNKDGQQVNGGAFSAGRLSDCRTKTLISMISAKISYSSPTNVF